MIRLARRPLLAGALAMAALSRRSNAQPAPVLVGAGADPVYSPWFVAAHEKMFEAAGLNVVVQSYTDGGEAMNALVARQVALAGGAEPTTIIRMTRAELRPLAVFYQSGRYIKLTARKEIEKPEQIRKFGMVAGTVSEYAIGLTLQKFKIDPASVTFIRSGPPELPALLARGDVDAYFAWEPWPTIGIRQGGHVLLTSRDVGYTDTLWLNARADWLAENAVTAKGILKVLARACDVVTKEPTRAAAAVQAVTKIPTAQTLTLLKDMDSGVRDFTDADMASFDGIADFLADHKVTPTRVNYRPSLQRGFFQA